MTTGTRDLLADLVSANRILGHEGILDAYGHVSARGDGAVRSNGSFWLSRARAPELVRLADILEFSPAGEPLTGSAGQGEGQPLYLERYIHAATCAARPDVVARCIAMDRNARVQEIAHRLGDGLIS